jgi:methyl-accepting chemotaxis protein
LSPVTGDDPLDEQFLPSREDDDDAGPLSSEPAEVAAGPMGLVGKVQSISMQVESLAGAVDDLRSMMGDRILALEDAWSGMWESQVKAVDEYRQHVDKGVAYMRDFVRKNNAELTNIAASTSDIAAHTAELADLPETMAAHAAKASAEEPSVDVELSRLSGEMAALRGAQGALTNAIAELRGDVAKLRRRIPLRAPSGKAPPLDDDAIQRIAAAVADRMERAFEVVPDD